jgi:hypothetical protein
VLVFVAELQVVAVVLETTHKAQAVVVVVQVVQITLRLAMLPLILVVRQVELERVLVLAMLVVEMAAQDYLLFATRKLRWTKWLILHK